MTYNSDITETKEQNMKKIMGYLALAIAVVAISSCGKEKDARADGAAGTGVKIGVIDMGQINSQAKVMKSLNSQRDKRVEAVQADVTKKRAEFEKREGDLRNKQIVMSQEAFARDAAQFQRDVIDFDKTTQTRLQAIEKGYVEALQRIQNQHLNDIVRDIGRAEGLDVVLNSQAAIVLNRDLMITDKVIEALDKKVKEIELKVGK